MSDTISRQRIRPAQFLHVEVKGTSGSEPRFFLTRNEHDYREASEWRLAMVVNALGTPETTLHTLREFVSGHLIWLP